MHGIINPINLLNAEHMYTCTFLGKKSLFLWEFFTGIMGSEWSQESIHAFILVKMRPSGAFFLLKV